VAKGEILGHTKGAVENRLRVAFVEGAQWMGHRGVVGWMEEQRCRYSSSKQNRPMTQKGTVSSCRSYYNTSRLCQVVRAVAPNL
jgi:hypothetical protein